MNKFDMNDLRDLAKEIDLAANHKSRVIASVSNYKVKEYLMAKGRALTVQKESGCLPGIVGYMVSTTIESITAPTVLPVVYSVTSVNALPIVAMPALGGMASLIGPVLALVSGAIAWGASDALCKAKMQLEFENFMEDVMAKQNLVNFVIKEEAAEILQRLGEKAYTNKRYLYLLAIISANEELKRLKLEL